MILPINVIAALEDIQTFLVCATDELTIITSHLAACQDGRESGDVIDTLLESVDHLDEWIKTIVWITGAVRRTGTYPRPTNIELARTAAGGWELPMVRSAQEQTQARTEFDSRLITDIASLLANTNEALTIYEIAEQLNTCPRAVQRRIYTLKRRKCVMQVNNTVPYQYTVKQGLAV